MPSNKQVLQTRDPSKRIEKNKTDKAAADQAAAQQAIAAAAAAASKASRQVGAKSKRDGTSTDAGDKKAQAKAKKVKTFDAAAAAAERELLISGNHPGVTYTRGGVSTSVAVGAPAPVIQAPVVEAPAVVVLSSSGPMQGPSLPSGYLLCSTTFGARRGGTWKLTSMMGDVTFDFKWNGKWEAKGIQEYFELFVHTSEVIVVNDVVLEALALICILNNIHERGWNSMPVIYAASSKDSFDAFTTDFNFLAIQGQDPYLRRCLNQIKTIKKDFGITITFNFFKS